MTPGVASGTAVDGSQRFQQEAIVFGLNVGNFFQCLDRKTGALLATILYRQR